MLEIIHQRTNTRGIQFTDKIECRSISSCVMCHTWMLNKCRERIGMRRRIHRGQCAKQFPGERLRKRFSTTNMDRSSMRFDRSTKHRIEFGVAVDDDDRTRIWRIRRDLLRNHRVPRHRCFALIFGAICRLNLIIAKFWPLPQSAASNTSDFIKPSFFCIVTLRMIFGSDDPRSKRNSLRFQTSDHCASQRSCIEHAQQDHVRDF